jgi:hypothetical protein
MARAIAHCMADADHRGSLAKLGAKRADFFRWENTARQTLEIYRAAIEGRAPVLDPLRRPESATGEIRTDSFREIVRGEGGA